MASRASLSKFSRLYPKIPLRSFTRTCLVSRSFGGAYMHRDIASIKYPTSLFSPVIFGQRNFSTENAVQVSETDEPDVLYRAVDIYVKGHEDSVLESYSQFAKMAANELGITFAGVLKPRMITDRVTLLRSVFIHKKHRAQYEAQTHKRVIQLKYLTGSTADTFLSYLQINIPAGVAMEVRKWAIERLPKHLEEAMEDKYSQLTEGDEAVAEKMRAKMAGSKSTTSSDYEEYHTTKPYLIGTHG